MSNKLVVDGLKEILADTYSLLVKTQNYHWNVEGAQFRSLHLLFEEQYKDLFAAADEVAERIRALGEKAPGTFTDFKKLSKIKEGDNELDAIAMIKDLEAENQKVSKKLRDVIKVSDEAEDVSTSDMLTARVTVHDKASWMLNASLPK